MCERPHNRTFFCEECQTLHTEEYPCGTRYAARCEPCSKDYQRKFYRKYCRAFSRLKHPKLVTVTLFKRPGIPHLERMRQLSTFMKRLRLYLVRRGYKINAFVWVLEYPNHAHMIIDGSYIPQRELSYVWGMVTGDSYIVDIRKADTRALQYLNKYLGKSLGQGDFFSPERIRSLHVIGSWGMFKDRPWTKQYIICVGSYQELMIIDEWDYPECRKPPPPTMKTGVS